MQALRIAFLCPEDPDNLMAWSGTHHFIVQALKGQGSSVEVVKMPGDFGRKFESFSRRVQNRLRPGSALPHTFESAKRYARNFMRSDTMFRHDFDVVVGSAASPMLAALPGGFPLVHISDTTFRAMIDYYESFSGLTSRAIDSGDRVEAAVLARADLTVLPSDWAARSAIDDYGVPAEKVLVAPFGPNLTHPPTELRRGQGSPEGKLKILFVGRRWSEKGADVAVEAVERLRGLGVDASLTLCGLVPPDSWSRDWIRAIPEIDKNTPAGEAQLVDLYREHDVFLLPSRAECYGLVLCESAAFGLPAVASRTGGIPTIVADGESGFLVAPEEGAMGFAKKLRILADNPGLRTQLSNQSWERYCRRLNWDAWGASVTEAIRNLIQDQEAARLEP